MLCDCSQRPSAREPSPVPPSLQLAVPVTRLEAIFASFIILTIDRSIGSMEVRHPTVEQASERSCTFTFQPFASSLLYLLDVPSSNPIVFLCTPTISTMYKSTLLLLASMASLGLAALNTTQQYRLKSELKPGQRSKRLFENLYLYSYHTGAGLGDATFARNGSVGITGFLNATNTSTADAPSNIQEFDLGTEFPW